MATPATSAPPQLDPAQQVFQLLGGYVISGSMQLVTKLRIPDRLANGPQPVARLAQEAGVNEDALFRVLRVLAMVGVFAESAPRTFTLTPLSELLRSDRPGLYPMALWITSPFHFRVWSEAMHAVQTGQPAAEKVTGMPAFKYFESNPEFSEIFNNAMTAFSAQIVPAVVDAYDFSGIDTLVDVAGGHGAVLLGILQKYPAMRGILTDLEHVLAGAPAHIAAANCQGRCTTQPVDFFKEVPAGGDAYIMQHIIHDWDDDRARLILKNTRKALDGKANGRVLVLETVIQPGNAPDLGKIIDLEMLMLPGGRERTEEEYRALFKSAGFELTRIVPTKSAVSVIEGRLA